MSVNAALHKDISLSRRLHAVDCRFPFSTQNIHSLSM